MGASLDRGPGDVSAMTVEGGRDSAEPGILHPTSSRRRFNYQRHSPDKRLADSIENFWTVTWDLTGEPDFIAKVLPYPAVNMSVTNEQADVTGLVRSRYDRHLTGRGYAVGARFRPGCFRPFLGSSVSKLTDTHRPIAEVFGRDTTQLQRTVAATSDLGERVSALTDFLLVALPDPDPLAVRIARLVEESPLGLRSPGWRRWPSWPV